MYYCVGALLVRTDQRHDGHPLVCWTEAIKAATGLLIQRERAAAANVTAATETPNTLAR
jgi:hypothetical protein